jgi:hypothetical protein
MVKMATVKAKSHKILCAALNRDNEVEHIMIKSGPSQYDLGGASLPEWIVSGCAQAVQNSGSTVGMRQLSIEMYNLIPDTPKYAKDRQELAQTLAQMPPGF